MSLHKPIWTGLRVILASALALLCFVLFVGVLPSAAAAGGNQVMGEIRLEGRSKIEKTSGVWVDGQYVGYLKELKGNKKILLLPGQHTISVRQNGFQDFTQSVLIKPGERQTIKVAMVKGPSGILPADWAEVKIAVAPNRAAVFLDGRFVGHVGEFDGLGRALLVAPGNHEIKIALPGYQTFQTSINPSARQKMELRTSLLKASNPVADPSIKPEPNQ